ncbi:hypothetical protein [Tenacibaculum sp. Bg11-29]|uniref:hypothetical protein n=1 Tax=Tenacibaculum sp. Bg11-29 TaxID=2058306 RepID=UPI0012FF57C5|nr:hypothetical protein [Tenacibaculum sp. Bg11-29]
MLKNISNLGSVLNKQQQQSINGGDACTESTITADGCTTTYIKCDNGGTMDITACD